MPQFQEQAESRWSWVVLLATLVTQGLTLGFPTCIGIFFADLQHDFQASNSETSWFPSIMISVLHAGGLLLDTTGKYSYLFYMSSFFLISAALFLGLSFFTLKKKEKMMDRAKEIIALENDLSLRSIEDPVPQPPQAVTYVTYVTSV